MTLQAPTLQGSLVRLEPLKTAHLPGLVQAAAESRDTYGFTKVPQDEAQMAAHVAAVTQEAARGEAVPLTQVDQRSGHPVGMTRFLTIRPHAVEIGGTWLAASAQRTGLNREAKLLLLTYAFEVWGKERVDLKTDARNQRSRNAITGIGATFEGVLRSWQPSHVAGEEHLFRDSAIFSIVRREWPLLKVELQAASVRPTNAS
jgi:RimJ/RimL family protein N-acetyltransferase